MTRLPRFALPLLATVSLGAVSVLGCGTSDPEPGEGCLGNASESLKTCARGATVTGVDVSVYQGNVNWSQIKGAGRTFAFARISDGLRAPDSKFAQNWPAMRAAGIVRGSYQFFRPSQDPVLQAQMVLDKLATAGGLQPGDLPPVLDLESADGLLPSVVVAKATVWLTMVEAAIHAKPIVYTAAFMSNIIGTSFGAYTLWVANYATTCPTMPSGWTDWHFWQHADNGKVPGISGNVDVDFFNGTLPELQTLTLRGVVAPDGVGAVVDTHIASENKPDDGSEGATLGSGTPTQGTAGASITPCR